MQKKEFFFFKIFSKNRRTQDFFFYPCGMYSSSDFVLMLLIGSGQFFRDLFCWRYINLDPVLKEMRDLSKFKKKTAVYWQQLESYCIFRSGSFCTLISWCGMQQLFDFFFFFDTYFLYEHFTLDQLLCFLYNSLVF